MRYELNLCIYVIYRLIRVFSTAEVGFDQGPVHVVIVMDMVLRLNLLSVLLFYSVIIIPPVRDALLTRRSSGRSLGNFKQSNAALDTGINTTAKYVPIV